MRATRALMRKAVAAQKVLGEPVQRYEVEQAQKIARLCSTEVSLERASVG